MRKFKILITVILFFSVGKIFSQPCVSENYPLKIGNVFVFKSTLQVFFPPFTSTSYFRTTITKDTIVNSKRYFFLTNYCSYQNLWWRMDSLTGNLFVFDSANSCPNYFKEKLFDSLCVSLGDSIKGCGTSGFRCSSTANHELFNMSNPSRTFDYISSGINTTTITRRYDMGFGLVSNIRSDVGGGGGGSVTTQLIGCLINGIAYGDSVTSVSQISSEIPERFSLSQNYPNPFNPSTRINYELKISNYVSLKVFDFLGKEVASLVNEKQNAGSYAVDFNSAEYNLPSGIYFYTLNAGEFKETRKMVLVK